MAIEATLVAGAPIHVVVAKCLTGRRSWAGAETD